MAVPKVRLVWRNWVSAKQKQEEKKWHSTASHTSCNKPKHQSIEFPQIASTQIMRPLKRDPVIKPEIGFNASCVSDDACLFSLGGFPVDEWMWMKWRGGGYTECSGKQNDISQSNNTAGSHEEKEEGITPPTAASIIVWIRGILDFGFLAMMMMRWIVIEDVTLWIGDPQLKLSDTTFRHHHQRYAEVHYTVQRYCSLLKDIYVSFYMDIAFNYSELEIQCTLN